VPTRLSRWAASPAALLAPAALFSALLVGILLARSVPMGAAALLGLCYLPLVLVNLRLGVVLWVPLTFLEGLPLFNMGGKAAGAIVAIGWIGMGRVVGDRVSVLVARNRAAAAGLVVFLVWITLSVIWADSPHAAAFDLWHWYAVALIFLVIATVVRDAKTARLVGHAFIVGGVLSILGGMFFGGLATSTIDLQAASSGRLYGAQGDPNLLAAGLVSGIVLAAGLLTNTRNALVRGWLLVAIGTQAIGIIASESRGGFVAAGATTLVALAFFKGRRAHVLLLVLLMVGLGGAWLSSSPDAWTRLTHFEDGSGRTDIWHVAERVFSDHPVLGVGLANFPEVSDRYVRRPGTIKSLDLIVDHPHVVHNLYLETLASLGVIGLALLLVFLGGCLRAAWEAGQRFDALRDDQLATLSRSVLVATIGFLIASIFISTGVDKRLWILLALGPALKGMAMDGQRSR
jgi:O-antigen ligase